MLHAPEAWNSFVFLRHKAMATFVLWGMISPSLILYSVCSCTYAV